MATQIEIRQYALKCQRCGYVWIPRKAINEVRICPRCKSAYWDTPKTQKN